MIKVYCNTAKFLLCDHEDFNEGNEDLIEWLEEALKICRTEPNPFESYTRNVEQVVPPLLVLLRECLLTHRWQDVAEILVGLVEETKGNRASINKVGCEAFYQNEPQAYTVLTEFIRQLRSLCGSDGMNIMELVIEFFLHLLVQQKFEEAQKFKNNSQEDIDKYKVQYKHLKLQYWSGLLNAYQGLIYFIHWRNSQQQYQQLHQQIQADPLGESALREAHRMDMLAERTLASFKDIEKKPGVWDNFLAHYIQILEEYDRKDEAIEIMENYVEVNTTNLWAKSQLYKLLPSIASEKRKAILKEICQCDPSNVLALELHETMTASGSCYADTLPLLFNILDYSQCRQLEKPWMLLSTQLLNITRGNHEGDTDALMSEWEERQTWWPQYHFSLFAVQQNNNNILESKIVVSSILLDNDDKCLQDLLALGKTKHIDFKRITEALSLQDPP